MLGLRICRLCDRAGTWAERLFDFWRHGWRKVIKPSECGLCSHRGLFGSWAAVASRWLLLSTHPARRAADDDDDSAGKAASTRDGFPAGSSVPLLPSHAGSEAAAAAAGGVDPRRSLLPRMAGRLAVPSRVSALQRGASRASSGGTKQSRGANPLANVSGERHGESSMDLVCPVLFLWSCVPLNSPRTPSPVLRFFFSQCVPLPLSQCAGLEWHSRAGGAGAGGGRYALGDHPSCVRGSVGPVLGGRGQHRSADRTAVQRLDALWTA